MSKPWPPVKLGELLKRDKSELTIQDDMEYKRLTIRMNGQGVSIRDRVPGIEIGTKRQFKVKAGQFLLSKIDARNGAFGIVPPDGDCAIVTGNFWAFDIAIERVIPRFIELLTKTSIFVDYSIKASSGTTNRLYLQEEKFSTQPIELPPIEHQRRIVARIDAVQQQLQQADALRSSIDHDIASLLAVRFQETLQHAEWRPMREVAPLVRREVTIHPEKRYSELGVRSFFKGAFARRTISGAEFTWQKLYEIKAGDLIFSNIMAWEKGIALAEVEHDGCVGNHRMLTCEALINKSHPAYLSHYFTTEEGFAKVYAASPGTAARNRTLTADSLMAITVPVPPIQIQQQFVALQSELTRLRQARLAETALSEAVVPALIARTMAG